MQFSLEGKMCRTEVFCTDKQASMAETGGGKFPLVFVFMGEYTDELHHRLKEFIMPQIEAGVVKPFVAAAFGPADWDADYSPWYVKTDSGREFAGNAPQYLDFLQHCMLPYLERTLPLSKTVYTMGYSLGGLAALYYYLELGFAGCISCSGSLWYPGFQDYCREQIEKKLQEKEMQIKDSVYFSLGGKEKNTTDPSMCHIEEDTRWTYEAFQKVAQTTFVHEPGGHMCKVERRLAHGLIWLLSDKKQLSGKRSLRLH
jgi:predicted alpha/beta superfamily hydrolase